MHALCKVHACVCVYICIGEGWVKLCSELFKRLSSSQVVPQLLSSLQFAGTSLYVFIHTVLIYACQMVRVSNISMCSSCLHSRVHVSVLYASIKSLMYAFCKSVMYLYVCATVLCTCHVISGSCMCVQPATQCLGIALITNLDHFQLKSVANAT